MTIHWPQGIWLALAALSLMLSIRESGKPKGIYDPVLTLINEAILLALLWWGGFFGGAS